MSYAKLLVDLETLQNIMVARAVGQGDDSAGYRQLRAKLIVDPLVKDRLPRFVHMCANSVSSGGSSVCQRARC